MVHSTAIATLHPIVAARESVGYMYQDGSLQAFPKFYGPLDLAPMGFMGDELSNMGVEKKS